MIKINKFGGIEFVSNLKVIKDLEETEKIELLKQLSNMFSTFVQELLEDEVELVNITCKLTKEDVAKWIN